MLQGIAAKYIIMAGVGLAVIAALILLTLDLKHWKSKAESYNAEAATMYNAAITASGNHKLERRDTAKQILALGTSLDVLEAAINRQDKAISDMAAASALDQNAAKEAVSRATGRVSAAEGSAGRLAASARSAPLKTASCEPSDTLKGSWK